MKVAFYTLGCKVNQYETQAISEMFKKRGYEIVDSEKKADVYVLISCTVTAKSDQKSRKAVSHFKKKNPNAVVALIGCYPQAFPEKAEKLESCDIVIGNKDKKRIVSLVESFLNEKNKITSVIEHPKTAEFEKMCISNFEERNRAFIKIQDGCNRFCSYCIIPKARGRICSKPIEEIINEVKGLVLNGYTEFVLVGIDLSSYGKEFSKTLTDAVESVSAIEGVKRIRLGSLEPEVISDDDIERLKALPNFCHQFHLSLQSGCTETLKRMNRHYTAEEYRQITDKLKTAFDDLTLTTDVMVGFAGESEQEFLSSLEFVKSIGFLKVHVFSYSVREGSRAAGYDGQISKEIKHKRSLKVIEETNKVRENILNEQIGKTLSVLIESKLKDGEKIGYSQNYIQVKVLNCKGNIGSIVDVKITDVKDDMCIGIEI